MKDLLTEEEARYLWHEMYHGDEDEMISTWKEKGIIKKSDLEKSKKEYYNQDKEVVTPRTIAYVNRLEDENERLKK